MFVSNAYLLTCCRVDFVGELFYLIDDTFLLLLVGAVIIWVLVDARMYKLGGNYSVYFLVAVLKLSNDSVCMETKQESCRTIQNGKIDHNNELAVYVNCKWIGD